MTDQSQLTRDDLKTMSPDEISAAHEDGRCDQMLGVPAEDLDVLVKARKGGPLTLADVAHLRRLGHEDTIVDAIARGQITTEEI